MALDDHSIIKTWTEDHLLDIPDIETDDYEYKSSRIRESSQYRTELKHKLCKTASAFWNTGGGIFIAGVDDAGVVDGGLPEVMGRQRLRDWVDQTLTSVVPTGPYTACTIKGTRPESRIEPDHVVLVVAFGESYDLPHMAPDNRYYVRAGGHSNPANHYLVEAIRARRGLRRPILRGLLREHPQKPDVIELAIIAANEIPALHVEISFDPLPDLFALHYADRFPLTIPVIDANNPFRMDLTTSATSEAIFGDRGLTLTLDYHGVMGNDFSERQHLDPRETLSPMRMRVASVPDATLREIAQQLANLNQLFENYLGVGTRA